MFNLFSKTDEEVTRAALNTLTGNDSAPKEVKISIEKNESPLSGESEWTYQRNAVKDSLLNLGQELNLASVFAQFPTREKSKI